MSSGSATSSRCPSAAEPTGTTADFDVDFSYVYSIPTPTPSGALATPTSYPHDGRFLGLESSSARREERLLHQGEEMSAIDWANDLLSRFPDGSDAPPMPWEVPSKPIGGGPDAGTVIGQVCFSGVGFGFGGGEPAGDLFGEALRTAPWSNLSPFETSSPSLSNWTSPQPIAPGCPRVFLDGPSPTPQIVPQTQPSPFSAGGPRWPEYVLPPWTTFARAPEQSFDEPASTAPVLLADPSGAPSSRLPSFNRFNPPGPFPSPFPQPAPQAHLNAFQQGTVDPYSSSRALELVDLVTLDPRLSSTPFDALEKAHYHHHGGPEPLLPTLPEFRPIALEDATGPIAPSAATGRVWWDGPIGWSADSVAAGWSSTTTTTTPPSATDRLSAKESASKRRALSGRTVELGPAWQSETDFFGPWSADAIELLDAEGQRLDFTALIAPPPRVRFDPAMRTWITYRRNNLSLDVALQVLARAPSELFTTGSGTPIDRFEVEWTAVTAPNGVEIELLQFDKQRRLSQAQRLQRQRLAPRDAHELDIDLEDQTAESDDAVLAYSGHFQRVRYSESTSNHPGHRRSQTASFVMLVSLFAVHADGSDSRLGGWTSAAHAVRGSYPKKFGEVKHGGYGVTGEGASASSNVGRSPWTVSEEPKPRGGRGAKKVKGQAYRRVPEYKSVATIEDSDLELERT